MKGILSLKKSVVVVAMCMAVLCLPGYSEPTPEQVKERTELLVEAIRSNNVEQAKICIKLGADVNAKVYSGRGDGGHFYVTTNKSLITRSDFDVYTIPTLAMAARSSKDIIELLIKSGTDINAKSNDGETMFIYAVKKEGWKDIVELLIKLGCDVKAKDTYGGTALMSAANAGSKDTVELLIKAGADVNAKNNGGGTALMSAASAGSKDTVELLIKASADISAKDNNGSTALMSVANSYELYKEWNKEGNKDNNYKNVAELLIKAGADSGSVLIWAIKKNNSSAAKLLINAGADVNATDNEGISALDNAILYGKRDIADLLRAAGARE